MRLLTILFFQLLILTSCNTSTITAQKTHQVNNAPEQIKSLIKSNKDNCSNVYSSNKIWVLEYHCPDNVEQQGIYISDTSGIRKFNWYDKSFNNWVWQEGCNTDKDCFYKVTTNRKGVVTELSYHFYVNLSEGYYKLTISNNKIIITEKKIVDHPS